MTTRTVNVRIPPDTGYVPLLRTAVAGIAARESYTLDEVDDLRMAVEEAAVLLLRRGSDDALSLDVTVRPDGLEAVISTTPAGDEPIDEASFSWMILSALADKVHAEHGEGRVRVVLVKMRSTAGSDE